ncbi:MAG: response regulator [Spirochaetales bacterium]|nr:response regulator [Spirochaetales bacterium]MCF7937359.1 response regulator [Spirochaetales bacterium]
MKKFRGNALIYCAVLAAFLLLTGCFGQPEDRSSLELGRYEIGSGETQESRRIRALWEYYPGELLFPDQAEEAEPAGYHALPEPWKHTFGEDMENAFGVATYRLVLETGEVPDDMRALFIPPISTAYRLFVNGEELASAGKVGTSRLESRPSYAVQTVVFDQQSREVELVLQISNFHDTLGGLWTAPISYGPREKVTRAVDGLRMFEMFIFSILLVIGIYHLARFLAPKTERYHLWFGLVSLLLATRTMLTGGRLLYNLLGISFDLGMYLEFLGLFLVPPLFFLYITGLFGPLDMFWYKKIRIGVPLVGIAASAACLFIPPWMYSRFTLPYSGVIFLEAVYIFWYLGAARAEKQRGTLIVGLATLILFAAGINDVLHGMGVLNTIPLIHYGALIFALLQVFYLIVRSQRKVNLLEEESSELSSLDRVRDEFVIETGEGLMVPINGSIGLAESLVNEELGALDPDQKATLTHMISSTIRARNMMQDLVDYSALKTGTLELNLVAIDLYQIVEVVFSLSSPLISGTEIKLENRITPGSAIVLADEVRLEQILYNILRQLLSITGSGILYADIGRKDKELVLFLRLEDREAVEKQLGSEFKHLVEEELEPPDVYNGSFVSFLVTRKLIDYHNGGITFGEDETGYTVSLTLPRGDDLSAFRDIQSSHLQIDQKALEIDGDVLAAAIERGQFTVMIVDDDAAAVQLMKNYLSDQQYHVLAAYNGRDALEIISKKKPDLVLLDLLMPGISGIDTLKKIRERYSTSELPVILVTARSEVNDMMEGFTSGANDFLTKPFGREAFMSRIKSHLQLAKINSIYGRFVPTEFLQFLGKDNLVQVNLGDQVQKEMTILFVDIRAFTWLSEHMSPEENFKFINSYLSRITPIIRKYGGFIDKFIGDSIMALYPSDPADAVKTAVEIMQHVHVYNGHRANSGYKPINVGIGIHTGKLILGIIGDRNRMESTVISDAVNLASRIQDLTKLYGANIIISQETFVRLDDPTVYDFRFLGRVKVKGKENSVSVFEIFNGDIDEIRLKKNETKAEFENAILLFAKRQFDEARGIFKDIVEINPKDRASLLFLDRTEKYLA